MIQTPKSIGRCAVVLAGAMATTPAIAAQTEARPPVPPIRIESASGDYSLQLVGVLQVTEGFYEQTNIDVNAPVLRDGTDVRRAHVGVIGTAFKDFTFTSVFDLAAAGGVAATVRDLTFAYTGFAPLTVTVGNQKPQNGLEASFSDRSNAQTFMEAAMTSDLATTLSTRLLGVRLSTGGSNYSASLGLFGDDINSNGVTDPAKHGWGVHGRGTYAPIATSGAVIHLGASGAWRRVALGRAAGAPLARQLRFRSRPESFVDGRRLVDTGNLGAAENYRFLGGEVAAVHGPFNLQSEYQRVWVNQGPARVALSFNGAYLATSYVLTGESRPYDARLGVFSRFRPRTNFDPRKGTWGAFELAGRISYIDLNDKAGELAVGGVKGGYETNYTAGLNWYWNSHFRLQVNYVRANVRNGAGASSRGTNVNILGLRAHQEW